jgi:hypothetical protein
MGALQRRLFGRKAELSIDNIKFTNHRIAFSCEKTLAPDPNTADIRIWNLTESQRKQISAAKAPLVRLAAGLGSNLNQIFYGNLIHSQHSFEGPDCVTLLSTGDGIDEYRKKRIQASFGPGTKASSVLRALIAALKLKPGNTAQFMRQRSVSGKASLYETGANISGRAADEMTALCRSAGLEWSIQDGALQLLDRNKPLLGMAIVLSDSTGLVGSPAISNDSVVSGTSLIVPDMFPGRLAILSSRFVKGQIRLERCHYVGDTAGQDWYCDFEGKLAGSLPL